MQPEPDRLKRSPFFPIERDITVRDGQETLVTAVAQRGGRVQVTVHLPDGNRVPFLPGLEVTVDDMAGGTPTPLAPYQTHPRPKEYSWGRRAPGGEPFTCLGLLTRGRHELSVSADGFESQRVAVLVKEGEITPIEVWLQR